MRVSRADEVAQSTAGGGAGRYARSGSIFGRAVRSRRAVLVAALAAAMGPVTAAAQLTTTAAADEEDAAAKALSRRRARRWMSAIGWASILIVVLLGASIAIIRFSRRYRAYLLRGKAPPTPSEDVWSMHKLREEQREDSSR